jgi:hypothetical protein
MQIINTDFVKSDEKTGAKIEKRMFCLNKIKIKTRNNGLFVLFFTISTLIV